MRLDKFHKIPDPHLLGDHCGYPLATNGGVFLCARGLPVCKIPLREVGPVAVQNGEAGSGAGHFALLQR